MITLHDIPQGSREWRELRKGKYTGSQFHELLKRSIKLSELTNKDFSGNYFTRRGHALELEACELYERIKNVKVNHIGFVENSDYPNCGCSPDGFTDDTLIEVKCFNEERMKKVQRLVPLAIETQIRFNMMIMELRKGVLLLYNPDLEPKEALKIIEFEHDQKIVDNFKKILATA